MSVTNFPFQPGGAVLPGHGVRRLRDDLGLLRGRVPSAAAVQAGHRLHRPRHRLPRQPGPRHAGHIFTDIVLCWTVMCLKWKYYTVLYADL